jgi:hypothetical protein
MGVAWGRCRCSEICELVRGYVTRCGVSRSQFTHCALQLGADFATVLS